jgi:ornithine cyclodeaminase/alanine dehydrogenase-like protein (mu-crystallin family)
MRELADDILLAPTSKIIVDSRESAGKEAGEIIQSQVDLSPT